MTEEAMSGATKWERRILNLLEEHIQGEADIQTDYRKLLERSRSASTKLLLQMILEDEARHHETLDRIAKAVKSQVEMEQIEGAVPPLDPHMREPGLAAATKRFREIEKEDVRGLRRLKREMREVRETTLWSLLLELMLLDGQKHQLILKFIADRQRPFLGARVEQAIAETP